MLTLQNYTQESLSQLVMGVCDLLRQSTSADCWGQGLGKGCQQKAACHCMSRAGRLSAPMAMIEAFAVLLAMPVCCRTGHRDTMMRP